MRKIIQRVALLIIPVLLFKTTEASVVDTVSIFSASMKKQIPCIIIRPEGRNGTSLPVLYLLHGLGNTYTQWLRVAPQLKERAEELNILIVCPDGGYSSWYLDNPLDSTMQYETFISRELVSYIDSHFPTQSDRRHRAIGGLSMGGHGAFFIAIRHKDIFGAAGSCSGVMDFPSMKTNPNLNKSPADTACCSLNLQQSSVMNVVNTLKNNELKLVFDCGVSDFLVLVNRKLHQKLLEKKIDHDYSERPGKHTAAYWKNSIDFQLLFFRKFFNDN